MIDQEKIVDDIMLDELEKKVPGCKKEIKNADNRKKRIGMLSVLGSNYQRDYFEGYINLIKKEKVCAEYITDIVYTLRNYIEVADTEIKTHGEVMTPLWMVDEMLDTLPEHVWKNPKLKWLDPANGVGTFPSVIVKRLMVGLKDIIPDSCERYQHIVENMIYVVEIQAKNMFLYHCAFDINDTNKLNTFYGSYLSKEFDNHMKNVWKVEKFDITIGNPPYQDELIAKKGSAKPLYNLFTEKSVNISEKILFITPSRWFAGGKGLDNFRKMMVSSDKITLIKHFDDATEIFGKTVDITGGVSYFIFDNNHQGGCLLNNTHVNLSKYDIVVNPKYYSIIDKVSKFDGLEKICKGQSYSGIITNDKRLSSIKKNDEQIKCYVSKVNGYEKWIDRDQIRSSIDLEKWKVITAESNGSYPKFGNKIISGPNEICNQSYIVFEVNNKDECESLLSYLNTKTVNFLLSIRKISQHIKPNTCKWIPIIPFDREWTDEMLYEHFNLTDDEINLIEEKMK
jgi:site-specific DNA-methyltransferase (adenine-specific)